MEDNIEKIRKDAIAEIKEKVDKNPKYLHPMNKEHQEDMKRLKFANGNDFANWMQQNGIMKNPTDIGRRERKNFIENAGCKTDKEYRDKRAQSAGFKDNAERYRVKITQNVIETAIGNIFMRLEDVSQRKIIQIVHYGLESL